MPAQKIEWLVPVFKFSKHYYKDYSLDPKSDTGILKFFKKKTAGVP